MIFFTAPWALLFLWTMQSVPSSQDEHEHEQDYSYSIRAEGIQQLLSLSLGYPSFSSEEMDKEVEEVLGRDQSSSSSSHDLNLNLNLDVESIISQADQCVQDEQLLQAARLLRQVADGPDTRSRTRSRSPHLTEEHYRTLHMADNLELVISQLLAPPSSHWKTQKQKGESSTSNSRNGSSSTAYDTSIFYHIDDQNRVSCRMETPIPKSLMVPLLSVLNEASLYPTWMPSWKRPVTLGLRDCHSVATNGHRGHQVVHMDCEIPWCAAARDLHLEVFAVDDIGATGCIIATMQTILIPRSAAMTTDGADGVASCSSSTTSTGICQERIHFDATIVFRNCPRDHPHYERSQQRFLRSNDDDDNNSNSNSNNDENDLILLQYTMQFEDANLQTMPKAMMQFVIRVVIGRIWSSLLHVAEEVRDGHRPEHVAVMRQHAALYTWLEQRCQHLVPTSTTTSTTPNINPALPHPPSTVIPLPLPLPLSKSVPESRNAWGLRPVAA